MTSQPKHNAMMEFKITAWGHSLVSCQDPQRIVITKGTKVFDDSVIAIRASASAKELPDDMKTALSEGRKISLLIHSAGTEDYIEAFGSGKMQFDDQQNITLTRADMADGSTVGVKANKAASDLADDLVVLLQDDDQEITLTLHVLE